MQAASGEASANDCHSPARSCRSYPAQATRSATLPSIEDVHGARDRIDDCGATAYHWYSTRSIVVSEPQTRDDGEQREGYGSTKQLHGCDLVRRGWRGGFRGLAFSDPPQASQYTRRPRHWFLARRRTKRAGLRLVRVLARGRGRPPRSLSRASVRGLRSPTIAPAHRTPTHIPGRSIARFDRVSIVSSAMIQACRARAVGLIVPPGATVNRLTLNCAVVSTACSVASSCLSTPSIRSPTSSAPPKCSTAE